MGLNNKTIGIRENSDNKTKVMKPDEFEKLENHIKSVTKDMADTTSNDNSLEVVPENVYATDKMVSVGRTAIDTGISTVKAGTAKTLDKLNKLREKRKNEARDLPEKREKSNPQYNEKRFVVVKPGKKLKDNDIKYSPDGKKKYVGIKTKKYSGMTKSNVREDDKQKNSTDALTMGMESLKRSFGIKALLGGTKHGGKKAVDLLLEMIKKVLKFLVFKLGIIVLPILAVAIIGASYYNNVTRATSEMKKSFKRVFSKDDDEDFYEYNSNFDEERAKLNAQIPGLVAYHNSKVQEILDENEGNYDKADISETEVDWDEIRETYMDLVIEDEIDDYLDTNNKIKEQMEELYGKMVVLKGKMKTEEVKEDGKDNEIRVLYVTVEMKKLRE